MSKNRGFTVIELIVSIAIAGIIMGAIGSFLLFNIRGFNATKDAIDIQYEGQLAMNQLTNIARESEGIKIIKDENGVDRLNLANEITVSEVVFEHKKLVLGTEQTTTYVLKYDSSSEKITMNVKDNSGTVVETYEMTKYLTGFTLKPTGSQDFEGTNSMEVHLIFRKKAAQIELQSHIKFRNK